MSSDDQKQYDYTPLDVIVLDNLGDIDKLDLS